MPERNNQRLSRIRGLRGPLRGFQGYTILGAFEDKSVNLKALKKYL